MRAINLIPTEQQRGAGGVAGRSGGAAYVLLGLLALLLVLVAATKLQQRTLADKRDQVASTQAAAGRAEAETVALAPFTQFAALREQRAQTVRSLAGSRFDWAHSLQEVARVIPADVWLTSLQATTVPGVTLKGGVGGPTGSLRSAIPTPAIELVGCTVRQESVARMVTRMRLVDGVTRVALQSSAKGTVTGAPAQGAASGDSAGASGDCRRGQARYPQFALVMFLDRSAGAVPTSARFGRVSAAALSPTWPTAAPAPSTEATP